MFLIVKLITPVCISKKLHSVQIYIFDSIGMPGYTDLYRIVSNCMKLKYYVHVLEDLHTCMRMLCEGAKQKTREPAIVLRHKRLMGPYNKVFSQHLGYEHVWQLEHVYSRQQKPLYYFK